MPLVECFVLLAKCQCSQQLKYTDRYVRKYMAIKVIESNFTADHACLSQWNEVLNAFGSPPMDCPEKARESLMQLLNA